MDTITIRSRQRWSAFQIPKDEYLALVMGQKPMPAGMVAQETAPGMRTIFVTTVGPNGAAVWTPLALESWVVENAAGQRIVLSDAEMESRYEPDAANGGASGMNSSQFDHGAFGSL